MLHNLVLWLIGSALAQPPAQDPALMQKAINVLQAQRNQALDGQAAAEANLIQTREELAKLKAELEGKCVERPGPK